MGRDKQKKIRGGGGGVESNSVHIHFYTKQAKTKDISKQQSKQAIRQGKLRKIAKCLLTRFS